MSKDLEFGTIEITIIHKNSDGNEVKRLQITGDEMELGEIAAWEDIVWTILTFEGFMPQTIEGFLSGEDYEPHIFYHKDDECDDEYDDGANHNDEDELYDDNTNDKKRRYDNDDDVDWHTDDGYTNEDWEKDDDEGDDED